MTQKEALLRGMAFVQDSYFGNMPAMIAARAQCAIAWLHSINWHTEANELEKIACQNPSIAAATDEVREDETRMAECHSIAAFVSFAYGYELSESNWTATSGRAFIDELWALVSMISPMRAAL